MDNEMKTRRQIARGQFAGQRAAPPPRRRGLLLAGGGVLVVIAVVVALIVVKATGNHATAGQGKTTTSHSVASAITSVPASTLNAVGAGTASALQPTHGTQPPLTAGGKPEVLYIGAEYCPYCAAERWALAVALSRFGTFSGLHFIHSSSTDVYPDTPTLSFYKSSYASKYVAFTPVEWYTVTDATLQPPTKAESALFTRYDAPPYVPAGDSGSFPFVDIGNKALIIGAQYLPSAFSGLTWSQVAAAIRNPGTSIARDVDGAANQITAELCRLTHGQPASACASAGVKAAAASG